MTVGQGQSEGAHNHVDSFDEYTSIIFEHCIEVKEKFPDIPIFVFGNSVVIHEKNHLFKIKEFKLMKSYL